MSNLFEIDDEIVSIDYVGEQDTIDINTTGNRLFYANGILTHNSAVEEMEFDHHHIAGGLSKIQTADNVIGIFTSNSMREQGRYQIQFMKTRSSSGVGSKVDLKFNPNTLRIEDLDEDEPDANTMTSRGLVDQLKRSRAIDANDADTTQQVSESLDLADFMKGRRR